jgi:hypothetical protein
MTEIEECERLRKEVQWLWGTLDRIAASTFPALMAKASQSPAEFRAEVERVRARLGELLAHLDARASRDAVG